MSVEFKYGLVGSNVGVLVLKEIPEGEEAMHFLGEMRLAYRIYRHPLMISWDCGPGRQPEHVRTTKDFMNYCIANGIDLP